MREKIVASKGWILSAAVLFLLAFLLGTACSERSKSGEESAEPDQTAAGEREIIYYTCGMHPSVKVSEEDYAAGDDKCPICNMDLVPVYRESEDQTGQKIGESISSASRIILSPRARALARVKTEPLAFRSLVKEIATVGQIVWDERRIAYVTARVAGRLDELYVNFTGIRVRENAPLASIYSPELLTTQEEFLLALETRDFLRKSEDADALRNAEALLRAARTRLALWGISDEQIRDLENSRTARTHMVLHAPLGGTVVHKSAVKGQYVKEGDILFRIADLSLLWTEIQIYENDLAQVQEGQNVRITTQAFPGEEFHGKVAFIEPMVDPLTRSVKARLDVPNPGHRLKPGMYVDASLRVKVDQGISAPEGDLWICPMCPEVLTEAPGECPECGMDLLKKPADSEGAVLAVPKEAVLDTGERTLVYVELQEGSYEPHQVILGPEAMAEIDGRMKRFFAVRSGLSQGMRVVTRASFLLDSQSQITGQAEATYSGALERSEKKKPPSQHIH